MKSATNKGFKTKSKPLKELLYSGNTAVMNTHTNGGYDKIKCSSGH